MFFDFITVKLPNFLGEGYDNYVLHDMMKSSEIIMEVSYGGKGNSDGPGSV